jgi:type IX secretion system PorP/SprF family membrane protein
MKTKISLSGLLLFCCTLLSAQQTAQYTQYMLNNMGMNPAYTGELGPMEFMVGKRFQWVGFPNAPVSTFVSAQKAFGKHGFYRGWHGVGAYVEQDVDGMFVTKLLSMTYAYHQRLAKNYALSVGVSVGVAVMNMDASMYDPTDPALAAYPPTVTVFPIISPGIRLRSKKVFFDLSVKQMLNNEAVSLDGTQELGTRTRLSPVFFFACGKKFISPDYAWTVTPSVLLRSSTFVIPTAEANVLVYYHKLIGAGITYRDRDAIAFMLQFRFINKVILGFGYEYSISRITSATSREAMFGFTPNGAPDHAPGERIAQCPGFDM